MVCDRCGNKLPPNTSVCKLCGYDNNENEEQENVIDVEVKAQPVQEKKEEIKEVKKVNSSIKNFEFNKITFYFSLFLMIIPLIAIGLSYYFMKFNTILVIVSIISIVIEVIACYMFISVNKNPKLENALTKGMVGLSFLILTFAIAMVCASYALKQQQVITEYASLFISLIAVSVLLLLSNVSIKILKKYS